MSTVEYTAEVTEAVVTRYVASVEAGDTYAERSALVKEIADELGASEASVRGKLTAEKVYVGKEKAKAKGSDVTSKDAYVKALEAIVGTELKSLTKATKADLKAVVEYITTASDQADAEAGVRG